MEIFNEQIEQRLAHNRKVLQEARDQMDVLVNGEKPKKQDGDAVTVKTDRRLPERTLTLKDLIVFTFKCLDMKDVVYVLFICLAVTLIGMYTPYVTKQIYDEVIPSGTQTDLLPILGMLLGASVGTLLFDITRRLMLMYIRYKVDATLQAAVMARTFGLNTKFFREYAAGDLSNRVMAITQISNELADTVLTDILTVLFSAGYFIQIFIFAPKLFGLSVCIMAAYLITMAFFYVIALRANSVYMPRQSKLNGLRLSIISGIQKIKTSGSELRAFAKVAKLYSESYMSVDKDYNSRFGSAAIGLITGGGTMLIYMCGMWAKIPLSDFMAYMTAYGSASGAMMVLGGVLPKLAQLKPLLELAKPLMDAVPETGEEYPSAEFLTGKIEIHNLSFRYADNTPYIFQNLDLTINPGEYVAIVGRSGCGKSTLIRLMLGFEKPESGSIFYDSYDLARTNKQSIRQKIGTCLQDGKMFSGTLFENVSITKPNATETEAWEALEIAALDDDVRDMPMGMHTLLSENGGTISGGQRQRLLIARAVLPKPSILFMDEATSALDNIKQKRVTDNLDKMHCTRITIAHRLSTIINCDRIIVLDDGRITEEGTFEQLMEKKELFYELSKRQL